MEGPGVRVSEFLVSFYSMVDLNNLDPKQKKRYEKVAKLFDEGEVALFEYLIELEDKIDAKVTEVEQKIPDLGGVLESVRGTQGIEGTKGDMGLQGPEGPEGKSIVGPQGPRGPQGPSGKDGTNGKDGESIIGPSGKNGNDGRDGSPDTGKEIVEKINALDIDDPDLQIDASHIKNIDKYIKKSGQIINAGIIGRDIVKDLDISNQLDGITKTFNIQAVWNIISVDLSSFPYGSLRKNTDYTWTPTSITFTSQIDASTQLQAGQSCVLTIVSG